MSLHAAAPVSVSMSNGKIIRDRRGLTTSSGRKRGREDRPRRAVPLRKKGLGRVE